MADIEQFLALDIRVGTIVEAEFLQKQECLLSS